MMGAVKICLRIVLVAAFLLCARTIFTLRDVATGPVARLRQDGRAASAGHHHHRQHYSGKPARAVAKFGTVLGMAPGSRPCPVYSCDYESADPREYPDRNSFVMSVDGIFTGIKWQCVELARRWLLLNAGYVFESIPMAYDIFNLTTVTRVSDNATLPLKSFPNGSKRRPDVGCMLIWQEGGEYAVTGHVAIVTEVTDTYVRIVEQNVLDEVWAPGTNWSRELTAGVRDDDDGGGYWVTDNYFPDGRILGWTVQTEEADNVRAARRKEVPQRFFF